MLTERRFIWFASRASAHGLVEESGRQLGFGAFVEALVRSTLDAMNKWELHVRLEELLDLGADALGSLDLLALNALYMFVVPERELYLSQMPYLETFSGFCSKISLMLRISPLAFFIFTRRRMKYQNRERAWVSFLVKSFMRYAFGLGSRSVGT